MKKKTPKIPPNYTEEEVVSILERIGRRLAHKFRFGYHDSDDIKQQAVLEGWKGLAEYDGVRPLENFLSVHIRNRMVNFKRDNYERIDRPCIKCPFHAYDKKNKVCLRHDEEDLENCEWFYKWVMRNSAKRNIVDTIDLDDVDDERESRMSQTFDYEEHTEQRAIYDILDEEIPMEYYEDYHKLKSGASIAQPRKNKVKEIVAEILKKYGYS